VKKVLLGLVSLAAIAAVVAWVLSAPQTLSETALANLQPGDAVRGEQVFWAGGCASCHAAPGAKGEDKLRLVGGVKLESPFGDFIAPNISMSTQDGLANWSLEQFANAMLKGTSPDGQNYFPAFPYTSYTRMELQDVADLFAFMKTLPAVDGKAPDHEVGFPFNIRRAVGLWKVLFLKEGPVVAEPLTSETDLAVWQRGRYLVEGAGHCGECHTPRNPVGGLELASWLAGAKAPVGNGTIPDITASEKGIGSWSVEDIAYYLESGFTPDYDSVGGEMVSVQENMAKLPASDREAIAVYLKNIPHK